MAGGRVRSIGLGLGAIAGFVLWHSIAAPIAATPLVPVLVESETAIAQLGLDEELWQCPEAKQALLRAIDHSLSYVQSPAAIEDYQIPALAGISRDRVVRSLQRFRQLLTTAPSAAALQQAVRREFVFYQSIGQDGRGTVAFTGYFEPVYRASRRRTEDYAYPLYRLPPDFDRWTTPHPTRAELEGRDGKGLASPLAGLELFWLRDRLEAFLVHVQGSARLELPDGAIASVGYAGKTDRPYTSIGMELVRDGILERSGLTLPAVLAYLRATPTALEQYLPRNESFIFFRETGGSPPTGSLGVPVTGDRSIATDKSLMPPGALAFIQVPLPYADGNGGMAFRPTHRFVLDQDTGSAIRGAGRVDVFLGTGAEAGDRAGVLDRTGALYYVLLSE